MKIGMLWLDDDKRRSLEEKVSRAAEFYENKYGQIPNRCYVNTNMLAEEKEVGHLWVKPAVNVLPHHFWIGIQGPEAAAGDPELRDQLPF
ncbi:MAG: hypothetical protein BMS9Abin02_1262 [Anaerolineae bacterium]|nr:MAG: hypothetical protein BMS9Abin02_1262 [Anaerolineae bacterium]